MATKNKKLITVGFYGLLGVLLIASFIFTPHSNFTAQLPQGQLLEKPAKNLSGNLNSSSLPADAITSPDLSVSPNPFNPYLSSLTISFGLNNGYCFDHLNVSIYSGAQLIYNVFDNNIDTNNPDMGVFKNGHWEFKWIGLDSNHLVVTAGNYSAKITVRGDDLQCNKNGVYTKTLTKSVAFTTQIQQGGGNNGGQQAIQIQSFTSDAKPSFKADGTNLITFSAVLNVDGIVTTSIPDDKGGFIRKLLFEGKNYQQTFSFTWDGKDELGNVVPTNPYTINLVAFDKANNQTDKTITVLVENVQGQNSGNGGNAQQVKINSIKVNPSPFNTDGTATTTISINLNTSANHGNVMIQDNNGGSVRQDLNSGAQMLQGNNDITWDGKDDNGKIVKSGNYKVLVHVQDNLVGEDSQTFFPLTVNIKGQNANPSPPPQGNQNGSQQQTQQINNGPAPDVITCQLKSQNWLIVNSGGILVGCTLKFPAVVNAEIVKGTFNPAQPPTADTIVKYILSNKSTTTKYLSIAWNGIDNYDSPAGIGDYSFVTWGKANPNDNADYSIQKFSIVTAPPVTQEVQPPVTPPTPPSPPTQNPTPQPQPTPPTPPAAGAQTSKCTGINYPNDIAGNWAKDAIKQAYDQCLFSGYADGSFRPNQPLTRAEAVKIALMATGHKPHLGCRDAHCGANYQVKIWTDIKEGWQGAWIRAGADEKIVQGYPDGTFRPNTLITRAEAANLVARAFSIPAHQGCYTPNCGAGYPQLFRDIADFWQGRYIRALWDKKVVEGISQDQFGPNRPITRAEMAALIFKLKGPAPSPAPSPAPVPASTQQTQP